MADTRSDHYGICGYIRNSVLLTMLGEGGDSAPGKGFTPPIRLSILPVRSNLDFISVHRRGLQPVSQEVADLRARHGQMRDSHDHMDDFIRMRFEVNGKPRTEASGREVIDLDGGIVHGDEAAASCRIFDRLA